MPAWLRGYLAQDDPQDEAASTIAMVIAWNQPFYPVYLWWIAGRDGFVAGIPDALSGLVFACIPALIRRHALAGRIALMLVSVGNTLVCDAVMGRATGVGLFLFPCAMLASVLFVGRERVLMLMMAAVPLLAWLVVQGMELRPWTVFPPAEAASMLKLNAISAGCLMVFLAWMLGRVAGHGAAVAAQRARRAYPH